jgi:hypothetical protein
MTAIWTCHECGTANAIFNMDCGTCGVARPRQGTGGILSQEILQNTESLGEQRIALREQGRQLESIRDSLNELWVLADSLKARVDGLEARLEVIDDECSVTVSLPPVFVDDARLEVSYD